MTHSRKIIEKKEQHFASSFHQMLRQKGCLWNAFMYNKQRVTSNLYFSTLDPSSICVSEEGNRNYVSCYIELEMVISWRTLSHEEINVTSSVAFSLMIIENGQGYWGWEWMSSEYKSSRTNIDHISSRWKRKLCKTERLWFDIFHFWIIYISESGASRLLSDIQSGNTIKGRRNNLPFILCVLSGMNVVKFLCNWLSLLNNSFLQYFSS